ncbi:DUF881 domain-containing protein [Nocardioides pacificus]
MPEQDSGRSRLSSALMRPSRAQAVVGALLAVVGFAAVTQVRATEDDDTYAAYREQDLIDVLSGLSGTSERAESEIARLEDARDDLQSTTSSRRAALEQAQERGDNLAILAGQIAVTGPGIRITIEEEDGTVSVASMLDTVQELRTAGAEAMEFNDRVRIVAQSAFEDGTGGIRVDGELLTSPFVIEVIGEPNTLAEALDFSQGPREQLEEDGASVEVEELEELVIESVRQPGQPEYSQADPGQ